MSSDHDSDRPSGPDEFARRMFRVIDEIAGEVDHPYHEVHSRLEALLMEFEEAARDPVPVLLRKLREGPLESIWVTCQLLEAVEVEPDLLVPTLEEVLPRLPAREDARIAVLSLAFREGLIQTLLERSLISRPELDHLHDLSRREALEQLEEDPYAAVSLYEGARELPREVILTMLEDLIGVGRPVVVSLLALWAEHPDVEVARVAVAGLGRYPEAETRRLLDGLETHRQALELEIEALVEQMEKAGIAAQVPVTGKVHRCLIGAADGRGSSMVHLSRQEPDGSISYLHLVVNEDRGIVECIGFSHEVPDEYEVLEQNLIEDEMVAAPLEQLRSRVQEALTVHREGHAPCAPPFVLWRHLLGAPLEPGRLPIDLTPYGLGEARAEWEEILVHSAGLVTSSPFRDWWPDIQETYDFVIAHPPLAGLEEGQQPPQELVMQFLEESPAFERVRLGRRLARTVEYLAARRWEGDDRLIRGTLGLWVALSEKGVSPVHMPFLVELGRVALSYVGHNVALGFTSPEMDEGEWEHEH